MVTCCPRVALLCQVAVWLAVSSSSVLVVASTPTASPVVTEAIGTGTDLAGHNAITGVFQRPSATEAGLNFRLAERNRPAGRGLPNGFGKMFPATSDDNLVRAVAEGKSVTLSCRRRVPKNGLLSTTFMQHQLMATPDHWQRRYPIRGASETLSCQGSGPHDCKLTLTIKRARRHHTGMYACMFNSVNDIFTTWSYLSVKATPHRLRVCLAAVGDFEGYRLQACEYRPMISFKANYNTTVRVLASFLRGARPQPGHNVLVSCGNAGQVICSTVADRYGLVEVSIPPITPTEVIVVNITLTEIRGTRVSARAYINLPNRV